MKKINKIVNHVKKHKVLYIIGAGVVYVVYQLTKICNDKGVGKDGTPYYEKFNDEPEDTEIKEMEVTESNQEGNNESI